MQEDAGNTGGASARAGMEQMRATAAQTGAQVRERAAHAADWARSQYSVLNDRVDANPRTSALLALGVGIIIGLLLRGGQRTTLD